MHRSTNDPHEHHEDKYKEIYSRYTPKIALIDLPEKISFIACGNEHVIAISIKGQVYSWGNNEHYQCGFPVDCDNIDTARLLPTFINSTIIFAAAANTTSYFVADNGILYGCGKSEFGSLGMKRLESEYNIFEP